MTAYLSPHQSTFSLFLSPFLYISTHHPKSCPRRLVKLEQTAVAAATAFQQATSATFTTSSITASHLSFMPHPSHLPFRVQPRRLQRQQQQQQQSLFIQPQHNLKQAATATAAAAATRAAASTQVQVTSATATRLPAQRRPTDTRNPHASSSTPWRRHQSATGLPPPPPLATRRHAAAASDACTAAAKRARRRRIQATSARIQLD